MLSVPQPGPEGCPGRQSGAAARRLVAAAASLVLTAGCGAAPSPASPDLGDASAVLTKIESRVPQVSLQRVYTAQDDPNHLLGQPGGYTSKVAFLDSRIDQRRQDAIGASPDAITRGGSVEVFADVADAQARAAHIQDLSKGNGVLTEYDEVRGPVLVRVSSDLGAATAAAYQDALGAIG